MEISELLSRLLLALNVVKVFEPQEPGPVADLGFAKYRGAHDAGGQTSHFLGIKYAEAARFDHAHLYEEELPQVQDATRFGPSCPQLVSNSIFAPDPFGLSRLIAFLLARPRVQRILKRSEDCLFINIYRPRNESLKDLPVLFYIHGGGFETGSSSSAIYELTAIPGFAYHGSRLVRRSMRMGQPMIVATINYRLAHFGFSASREMRQAGLLNLGFEDQRVALHWVQQHIAAFGGDPAKVVIAGQSAGAISVTAHMLANDGHHQGLFRGAIGMSGAMTPTDGPERQQKTFDELVEFVGCNYAADKVDCLRRVPVDKIEQHMHAMGSGLGYSSLALQWNLRADGRFFNQSLDRLAVTGRVAPVPVIYGCMVDEGTLFNLFNSLILLTTKQVKTYLRKVFWPAATDKHLDRLMELYPQSPRKGSPYGTGLLYAIPPQYKRLSSLIGDYFFEASRLLWTTRRLLLANVTASRWNYQIEAALPLPGLVTRVLEQLGFTSVTTAPIPQLGSFHAADLVGYVFGGLSEEVSANTRNIMSAIVSFTNKLDPNHGGELPHWPQWDIDKKLTMRFGESRFDVIEDTYRDKQMSYMSSIRDSLRI
ncbi:hypothetical protein HIM_04163 [Hirsutella minnesotensis 3608]|uniref:Carboxylic ester hydrolase n=1 Tax=Hirsutella minnesotensis 3608 TaxID=1043627 RepID=A0A0F8A644_9HYPO|nr:hypothetical protein HIM_04163 [Hirsutella minnesotensis 3608]